MEDIKKLVHNPRLYYIVVPAIAALWPLWAGLVAMNKAQSRWEAQKTAYDNSKLTVKQILMLDGERLLSKKSTGVFSYPSMVNRIAGSVGISPQNYRLQEKAVIKVKSGQETQDADVTLNQVDMATFARFLSSMLLEGANMQCNSISLTKQKGSADLWTAQMTFKYFKG